MLARATSAGRAGPPVISTEPMRASAVMVPSKPTTAIASATGKAMRVRRASNPQMASTAPTTAGMSAVTLAAPVVT